ncbi:MAG TPA: hypothetical protein DF383_12250 [Deltaproteobacteria bacterium]|nr:hypothetical protein [Deltaproteobacteria bacterium]
MEASVQSEFRGMAATFHRWSQDAKIPPSEIAPNGKPSGQEITKYILNPKNRDKFSHRLQKQIDDLLTILRTLGYPQEGGVQDRGSITAEEILLGLDAKTAAGSLNSRGKRFEAEANGDRKKIGLAEAAYRMALQVDPDNLDAQLNLAKFYSNQGNPQAARQSAAIAVLRTEEKNFDDLLPKLQELQDPFIQQQGAINFAGQVLVDTRRFDQAARLYEKASQDAKQRGEKEAAERHHEKALLIGELKNPITLAFKQEAPQIAELCEKLRALGIPYGLMAGATESGATRELSAVQFLRFIDSHLEDPRVRQALQECGYWPPQETKIVPLAPEYQKLRIIYHRQLGIDFQEHLTRYKSFSAKADAESARLAEAEHVVLHQNAQELLHFSGLGQNPERQETVGDIKKAGLTPQERFQDLKMIREYYRLRVQDMEAEKLLAYEGEFTVSGIEGGIPAVAKRMREEVERREAQESKHTTQIMWKTLPKLAEAKQAMEAVTARMSALCRQLEAPPAAPKSSAPDLEALGNAELLVDLHQELGEHDAVQPALEAWQAQVMSLPAEHLELRLTQQSKILRAWENMTAREKRASLHHSTRATVNQSVEALAYDKNGLVETALAYARREGIPVSEEEIRSIIRNIRNLDEHLEGRLFDFLSPQGLKGYAAARHQADQLMRQAVELDSGGNQADAKACALQALRVYGILGDKAKIKVGIEYIETLPQHTEQPSDIAKEVEWLETYAQMASVLEGSGIDADTPDLKMTTFEDLMREQARAKATKIAGVYTFQNNGIAALMAAKSFFERDGNEEAVGEINKKIQQDFKDSEERVEAFVNGLSHGAAQETAAFGPDLTAYPEEVRTQMITRASELANADLVLFNTQDLSQKDARKAFARQALRHLDLWRQAVETSPRLPAEFRREQIYQLAKMAAVYKATFTRDESKIKETSETKNKSAPSETPLLRYGSEVPSSYYTVWNLEPPPDLKLTLDAIDKLGAAFWEERAYEFHPGFSQKHASTLARARAVGLSPALQRGIEGYCLDQAATSDDTSLTQKDWEEIAKLQETYRYDSSLQEVKLETYLIEAGKFRPLSETERGLREKTQKDFALRFHDAMVKGQAPFLSALKENSLTEFAQRVEPAYDLLDASRDLNIPQHLQMQKAAQAAKIFGSLGLEHRVEESLGKLKQYLQEKVPDPAKRASGYWELAQVYEESGMEKQAAQAYRAVIAVTKESPSGPVQDMGIFAEAKLALLAEATDKAKQLLHKIRHLEPARLLLQQIDEGEAQTRAGFAADFLEAVLMVEVDKRRGTTRDLKYHAEKAEKADQFMHEVRDFVNTVRGLCGPGRTAQQALIALKNNTRYLGVYRFLQDTPQGQATLAYIKTLDNPQLSNEQIWGETLRFAEQLLDREDFDYATRVATPLQKYAAVSEQARILVKNRIPEAAQWAAFRDGAWRSIKDMLIIPAIVEGRYVDALFNATTTIISLGAGRLATLGAKWAWKAASHSVRLGGKLGRFSLAARRGFDATRFLFTSVADNLANELGSAAMDSLATGEDQFTLERMARGVAGGFIPVFFNHAQTHLMQQVKRRAEYVSWMKVTDKAEAALLRSQGKVAVKAPWRVALKVGDDLASTAAFTFGGLANEELNEILGLGGEENISFLQHFARSGVTAKYTHIAGRALNKASLGGYDNLDRQYDQDHHLFSAFAALGLNPGSADGQVMAQFLDRHGAALAEARGKPLSSAELAQEARKLGEPVEALRDLMPGPVFEAARRHLFDYASSQDLPPEHLKARVDAVAAQKTALDEAVKQVFGAKEYSDHDRELLKGALVTWAVVHGQNPEQVSQMLDQLRQLAPQLAAARKQLKLDAVHDAKNADAPSVKARQALYEKLIFRVWSDSNADSGSPYREAASDGQMTQLKKQMDLLLKLGGLENNEAARLAMLDWVLTRGFDVPSLLEVYEAVKSGQAELRFEGGKFDIEEKAGVEAGDDAAPAKAHGSDETEADEKAASANVSSGPEKPPKEGGKTQKAAAPTAYYYDGMGGYVAATSGKKQGGGEEAPIRLEEEGGGKRGIQETSGRGETSVEKTNVEATPAKSRSEDTNPGVAGRKKHIPKVGDGSGAAAPSGKKASPLVVFLRAADNPLHRNIKEKRDLALTRRLS